MRGESVRERRQKKTGEGLGEEMCVRERGGNEMDTLVVEGYW